MTYVNLPENKAFHPLQSDTVTVNIKMSGWKVFMERLRPDTAKIQVDLSGLKSRNFIVFGNQIGFINRQFPGDKQVVGVSPDTLYFDFSKQTQRKVPVKAVQNLTFQRQYGVIGATRTVPEYVTITGPLDHQSERRKYRCSYRSLPQQAATDQYHHLSDLCRSYHPGRGNDREDYRIADQSRKQQGGNLGPRFAE